MDLQPRPDGPSFLDPPFQLRLPFSSASLGSRTQDETHPADAGAPEAVRPPVRGAIPRAENEASGLDGAGYDLGPRPR